MTREEVIVDEDNALPKVAHESGDCEKKTYEQPKLRVYGDIKQLTNNAVATSGEGGSGMGMIA